MSTIARSAGTFQQTEGRTTRAGAPCWCGQELDVVRHGHCPRCGRRRAAFPH